MEGEEGGGSLRTWVRPPPPVAPLPSFPRGRSQTFPAVAGPGKLRGRAGGGCRPAGSVGRYLLREGAAPGDAAPPHRERLCGGWGGFGGDVPLQVGGGGCPWGERVRWVAGRSPSSTPGCPDPVPLLGGVPGPAGSQRCWGSGPGGGGGEAVGSPRVGPHPEFGDSLEVLGSVPVGGEPGVLPPHPQRQRESATGREVGG